MRANQIFDLKNIRKLSPNTSTVSQPKEDYSTPELSGEWVKEIFRRFGSLYGHLWLSRVTKPEEWEMTQKDWARELAGMTPEELRRALQHLPTMPPSAPQFKALGKEPEAEGRTHHAAYREWRPEHRLPAPRDPEKAQAAQDAIAAMRAKFGIKR